MKKLILFGFYLSFTLLIGFFLFWQSDFNFQYIISNRLIRLGAIIIGGVCVAFSAICFQTICGNRIITPAIMGYEAIYLCFQATLILIFGTASQIVIGAYSNFFLSIVVMLIYSFALQQLLFKNGQKNVYFLLLSGLIITLVISSITQLIHYSISPGEFAIFQGFSLTSFNRVELLQLIVAFVITATVVLCLQEQHRRFDILLLGQDQAQSLGINTHHFIKLNLALIAILVAVSTSLLGPTAFMGIFVANLAYSLVKVTRHWCILKVASIIAITAFLIAQVLVEHVFNYRLTAGILVNLFCAAYFLVLIIRPRNHL